MTLTLSAVAVALLALPPAATPGVPPGVPPPVPAADVEALTEGERLAMEVTRGVHAADRARTHTERLRATADAVAYTEELLRVEPRLGRMLAFNALATQMWVLGNPEAVKLAAQRPGYRRAVEEVFVTLAVRPWQPMGIMQNWNEGDDPVQHQVAVEFADIAGTFELTASRVSRARFDSSGLSMLFAERFKNRRAPEPLIERMFETTSLAALSEFKGAFLRGGDSRPERDALTLAEAKIEGGYLASRLDAARLAEAKAEMARLSKSERWWVRMFVVYTMADTRPLWDEEVAVALLADADPFVARIARERLATVRWATGEAKVEAKQDLNARPHGG